MQTEQIINSRTEKCIQNQSILIYVMFPINNYLEDQNLQSTSSFFQNLHLCPMIENNYF